MVCEGVVPPVSVKLCLDERRFVEVLAFFGIFIHPQLRKHPGDDVRHESAEDGISCVLGGCRQYAAIETLLAGEEF